MKIDRYYIGGGNIAGICGVSPYRTPLDEYHVITGTAPDLDVATERFFKRRKALEPYIAALLEENGLTVAAQNQRYTDPEFPFLRAEIDAETTDSQNAEFKSVHPLAAKDWGLEAHDDSVPDYVTIQAQWGLGVLGSLLTSSGITRGLDAVQRCRVVAAIGFDDSRVYPVERADDVIQWARAEAIKFWEQHVIPKVPPPPRTVADILNYITPDPDKVIEATDIDGFDKDVADYLELRDAAKDAESRLDAAKARIQLVMVDATTLTLHGKKVLTWKPNRDSIVTDHKALATRLAALVDPEVAAAEQNAVTTTKPGARVFRVAKK